MSSMEESEPLRPQRNPLFDVAYYLGADSHPAKHKLDIYLPSNGSSSPSSSPVVLHVHGGGWARGDRKHEFYGGPFMGRSYAQRGYVSVVCSYRLAAQDRHPAQVRDVARALLWVHAYIKNYGGNPAEIFLSGHSAGAHLISLLALHPKYLGEVGLDLGVVKGVIAVSGIYSLLYPMAPTPPLVSTADKRPCPGWKAVLFRRVYVRPNFGEVEAELHDASPLSHLPASAALAPPFLVLNASSDLGLEIGGDWFAREMVRHNVRAVYEIIPNTNHASVTRSAATSLRACRFVQEVVEARRRNSSLSPSVSSPTAPSPVLPAAPTPIVVQGP